MRTPGRRGRALLIAVIAGGACLLAGGPAQGRLTRLVLGTVQSPTFGGISFGEVGPYEKLVGRGFGELDPGDPRNAVITDRGAAPRNPAGKMPFARTRTERLAAGDPPLVHQRLLLVEDAVALTQAAGEAVVP